MLLVVGQLLLLLTLEGSHALEHLIPIHEGAVKLWTVDADELRLAANRQSAGSAHTRTIHHDGVQADFAGDVMLLGSEVRELHHDWRTNGEDLVYVWLLLDKLLDTNGYYAFLTVTAVVGHDDHLVRTLAHLILQDDQILRATSHH